MKAKRSFRVALLGVSLLICTSIAPFLVWAAGDSFIGKLNTIEPVASTVPANGDVNPYGVAVVRHSIGNLVKGHILVSNFNNSDNLQGTGTTIVQISPKGTVNVFAQIDSSKLPGECPGGIGLTTALVVFRSGWVIVGSLPTSDGMATTARSGCLLVLNSTGQVVETIHGNPINGPWDMTAVEGDDWAALFVTNVLNGTVAVGGDVVDGGTVVRIDLELDEDRMPEVVSKTVIGSGFPERTDPNALVIGPTGVGLGRDGTLYVADTLSSRIAAISDALDRQTTAGIGETISAGGAINGPLGLAIAPNGHILVVNANDGNMVETTPKGNQVEVKTVTGGGAGSLFGLAVAPHRKGVYFVDDSNNTLNLLH
jgi:hypothetical protein